MFIAGWHPSINKNMTSTERYSCDIRLPDATIHCEIAGLDDAPALVFLHGNSEDLHIFDPQIRYFSQYYKIIAIDTRGHGKSTMGTVPFNFHTFAADLIAVMDALQIEKAHIVGFSDGANTALHVALIAPERILSMILLGPNYHPKGLKPIVRLQIKLAYIGLSFASLFSAKLNKRKKIWGLMVFHPNLTTKEIAKIIVYTLIIIGENDMVNQCHMDELHNAIARSKLLTVPDGDHFWMFQNPDMLNQYMMEFLIAV
jgi:pimeloyl-ACP methyl ester carboxylesterase